MAVQKHWVIFDGDCGFCQASVRLIKGLDWFQLFGFTPFQEVNRVPRLSGLVLSELSQSLHCVSINSQVTRAAEAVRFIAVRCPLTSLPALLLWLPGAMWLAEKLYGWVARHRLEISKFVGIKISCKIG